MFLKGEGKCNDGENRQRHREKGKSESRGAGKEVKKKRNRLHLSPEGKGGSPPKEKGTDKTRAPLQSRARNIRSRGAFQGRRRIIRKGGKERRLSVAAGGKRKKAVGQCDGGGLVRSDEERGGRLPWSLFLGKGVVALVMRCGKAGGRSLFPGENSEGPSWRKDSHR